MEMLSEQLKKYRRERGMSQKEVASMIFMSQQAYAKYEVGTSTPNPETLARLAEIFGVSVDDLVGEGKTGGNRRGLRIPVLGNVAAGIPIEAITDVEDFEEITEEMAANGEYVALHIHGQSMEPRMTEGDVVIVRLQDDVDSGDTAIVLVNGGDATCKKVKKTADGIMLLSLNPAYEPMYYSNEEIASLPVRIFGKVVELRAKF